MANLPSNIAGTSNSSIPRRSFSLYVVGAFIVRIVMIGNSLAAGIIVAHLLGVTGLGELAVINVSVVTLVQFGSFGLPSANTFFIARDVARLRSAAINSLIFAMLFGSLLALGLVVAAKIRPEWFSSVSPRLISIAAVSIPFQLLTLIGLNILLAVGRFKEFNAFDLIGQSFVLINSLVALVFFHRGLEMLVTLNTAASVVVCLAIAIAIVFSGKKLLAHSSSWRADLSLFSLMMRYGLKFHISLVASALIFRADLLVVNHYRGAAEAGVYSVASQMATMLMLLPSVIATLLFPRVTAEQDSLGETTCRVTRHTAFVMFVCCVVAVPLSFLLPVLYGPAFYDSTFQLIILIPGVYLVGLQSVLVQHFNALGLPRSIPLFWLLTLAVNVVLVFGLVPSMGGRGAAVASTISYTLIFVLVVTQFRLSTGRRLLDVFLLRRKELQRLMNARSWSIAG